MLAESTLSLTDDEAAVMAVHVGKAWRTPLPTVDETSEAGLAAAILRGRRSLGVRDLAKPDGTVTGAAAEVLARLGGGPRAAFLLVDSSGTWVQAGLTMYLYGPAPDVAEMSHVVSAAGVHHFRFEPPRQPWPALTELAEAIFRDGFAVAANGSQQPAAAMLCAAHDAALRIVRVAQGSVHTAVAGDGQDAESVSFPSVPHAVAWLRS